MSIEHPNQHEQALLEKLAYDAWQQRGQPFGSSHVDWDAAKHLLAGSVTDNPPPNDEMVHATNDA